MPKSRKPAKRGAKPNLPSKPGFTPRNLPGKLQPQRIRKGGRPPRFPGRTGGR